MQKPNSHETDDCETMCLYGREKQEKHIVAGGLSISALMAHSPFMKKKVPRLAFSVCENPRLWESRNIMKFSTKKWLKTAKTAPHTSNQQVKGGLRAASGFSWHLGKRWESDAMGNEERPIWKEKSNGRVGKRTLLGWGPHAISPPNQSGSGNENGNETLPVSRALKFDTSKEKRRFGVWEEGKIEEFNVHSCLVH